MFVATKTKFNTGFFCAKKVLGNNLIIRKKFSGKEYIESLMTGGLWFKPEKSLLPINFNL